MNHFSQPNFRALMLGGSLLTSLSWGAGSALAAETFYAPHAVHNGTAPAITPTSNQRTVVQPAAFQGNRTAPAAGSGNGSGSAVQQHLDELYRKDGREAPQMTLQQTPMPGPNQPGSQPVRSQSANVVPPKSRNGFLSRINPFKSKSAAVPMTPLPPLPSNPGVNQAGYGQNQPLPGQNQVNQQFNRMNGQINNQANQFNNQANQFNNQVNQVNGQINNQTNQTGNQVQQFNNQTQQFGNQARQFNQQLNQQPAMSIQPAQQQNLPPAVPPSAGGELRLPMLPGDNADQPHVETPPTNFGPNAPKIQKSEPDLLKDVFSDEPESAPFVLPQRKATTNLIDELPEEPKLNDSSSGGQKTQSREPAASEIDSPFVEDVPLASDSPLTEDAPIKGETPINEDSPRDRLPLAIDDMPVDKPIPEPRPTISEKRTTNDVRGSKSEEKMKIIAERGELRGLKGFCPVALHDERDLKNALPEFHSVYKGRTYYFHSADAKALFDETPQQYAPAASGLDVVLRKSKTLKEGSLDFALWYKDRLYLFTSQKTLEQFEAAPKEFAAND